ncbi:MAG: preprotein translocase subunit TatB [Firmicutes bacterium]|nr:preprotein translocase subunit TatB [Bacillota bacterium]
MQYTVDARGLSCPEPVILTRQALNDKSIKHLKVLVDAAVARENVTRSLLQATGKQPQVTETSAGEWEISIKL